MATTHDTNRILNDGSTNYDQEGGAKDKTNQTSVLECDDGSRCEVTQKSCLKIVLTKLSIIPKEGAQKSKIIVPSVSFSCNNFGYWMLVLLILIVAERWYQQPLIDWSLSENGIPHTQKITSESALKFWKFLTELGGGKEIQLSVLLGLVFCSKSRWMYYVAVMGFIEIFKQYFKLAYHDPRPYMISDKVAPLKCSIGFGNPSGHCTASSVVPIVYFLDFFHGSPISVNGQGKPNSWFSGWFPYLIALALGIFWMVSIPFTRFLLGVHSLDQIVYGCSLGLWLGLFLHFMVRDHIIRYIEKVNLWQHRQIQPWEIQRKPVEVYEYKNDINKIVLQEQAKAKVGAKRQKDRFDDPQCQTHGFIALFVFYLTVCIFQYAMVESYQASDDDVVIKWSANFKKGCGKEMDMTNALHYGAINGCCREILPVSFFIFYIYRHSMSKYLIGKYEIQDITHFDNVKSMVFQTFLRLLILTPICTVAGCLMLLVKKEMLWGSQILILFTNAFIPCLLLAWFVAAGPYEYFAYRAGLWSKKDQ